MRRHPRRPHRVEQRRKLPVPRHRSLHLVSAGPARPFQRKLPRPQRLPPSPRGQTPRLARLGQSLPLARPRGVHGRLSLAASGGTPHAPCLDRGTTGPLRRPAPRIGPAANARRRSGVRARKNPPQLLPRSQRPRRALPADGLRELQRRGDLADRALPRRRLGPAASVGRHVRHWFPHRRVLEKRRPRPDPSHRTLAPRPR